MEEEKKTLEETSAEESAVEEQNKDPLEEMTEERDRFKDLYMRSQAEFQNFKKRVDKEKSDIYKFANERYMSHLLGIMDNIDRALLTMENTEDGAKVKDGIEKVRKSLFDFFEREGIKAIESIGKPFDPNLHHAVLTEVGDEDDMILEELQKGYTLNDKILRPSMVKVSKQEEENE